jgi:hypothetical protein
MLLVDPRCPECLRDDGRDPYQPAQSALLRDIAGDAGAWTAIHKPEADTQQYDRPRHDIRLDKGHPCEQYSTGDTQQRNRPGGDAADAKRQRERTQAQCSTGHAHHLRPLAQRRYSVFNRYTHPIAWHSGANVILNPVAATYSRAFFIPLLPLKSLAGPLSE